MFGLQLSSFTPTMPLPAWFLVQNALHYTTSSQTSVMLFAPAFDLHHHFHAKSASLCEHSEAIIVCMQLACFAGKLLQQLTQSFTDHSSSDCRQQYFEILRSAWQLRPAMHAALRPALLSMLGDADPTIRAQALEFWDSALPKHVGQRLQALLQDSLTEAGLLVCTTTSWAMSALGHLGSLCM